MTVLADAETSERTGSAVPVDRSQPPNPPDPATMPLERLEAEICTLAGQIAAATIRFLALLAHFDAREGWSGWDIPSCAQWLSWRCGLDVHTAREYLRVARSLLELPRLAEAFGQGRVSYSKVRALTRVATADNEQELVHVALHNPASHVDRLVRGLRKAQRTVDDDEQRRRSAQGGGDGSTGDSGGGSGDSERQRPRVQWRWDDNEQLVIWGRLSAEDGARLLAGLSRMDEQRRRTDIDTGKPAESGVDSAADDEQFPQDVPAGTSCGQGEPAATSHPSFAGVAPADLAPALVAAAELMCTAVDSPIHAPAAEVLVHVDVDTLVQTGRQVAEQQDEPEATSPLDADHPSPEPPPGTALWRGARIDDGPAINAAILQMLCCDGRIQLSVQAADGRTLNLGRRRRRPTAAQLGVLWRRDRGCTHPGCGRTRFLHAHHVVPWAAGGPTDLDNLILLCGEHHRLLHDGGFAIVALGKQKFRFHGPHGAERPTAPTVSGDGEAVAAAYTHITPSTIEPDWDGSPLDLAHATDVYLTNWANAAARRES